MVLASNLVASHPQEGRAGGVARWEALAKHGANRDRSPLGVYGRRPHQCQLQAGVQKEWVESGVGHGEVTLLSH